MAEFYHNMSKYKYNRLNNIKSNETIVMKVKMSSYISKFGKNVNEDLKSQDIVIICEILTAYVRILL